MTLRFSALADDEKGGGLQGRPERAWTARRSRTRLNRTLRVAAGRCPFPIVDTVALTLTG
jgi:hypothetical protein